MTTTEITDADQERAKRILDASDERDLAELAREFASVRLAERQRVIEEVAAALKILLRQYENNYEAFGLMLAIRKLRDGSLLEGK